MRLNNNQQAFFALLKAGLWEHDVRLLPYGDIDFSVIYKLAEEQSVVGLIAAGLEHVTDLRIPKEKALLFAGNTLQLEKANAAMNRFIAVIIDRLRSVDIYSLLVKGQGVAQCYERPLWRACGDVDLLLSDANYTKAKDVLLPLASAVEEEYNYNKHIAYNIDSWVVELHGNLFGGLWHRIDNTIEDVQNDVFFGGSVRSWLNGNTQVFLPGVNEDVFFVFTHILQHYFKEGIGLRQICDWCRFLWTYRELIDNKKLLSRLKKAGIISEWKVFAKLAVEWLGMPEEYMPLYSKSKSIKRKAGRVLEYILDTGNFGHNKDFAYKQASSSLKRKLLRFNLITGDTFRQFLIFPEDSLKVWWYEMLSGFRVLRKREIDN